MTAQDNTAPICRNNYICPANIVGYCFNATNCQFIVTESRQIIFPCNYLTAVTKDQIRAGSSIHRVAAKTAQNNVIICAGCNPVIAAVVRIR